MPVPRQLIVDAQRIVHETIDDETILIDLDTGTYFSLTGAGPEIWALALDGRSADEVVATMARRYQADPQPVAALTTELLQRLRRDELLSEGEAAGLAAARTEPEPEPARAFRPPVLETFTDMQHFLMLDPIHEVQDGGWPHAPAPPRDAA